MTDMERTDKSENNHETERVVGAASGSRIEKACKHLKNEEAELVAKLVHAGWPDFGVFWGVDDGRNWVEIGGGVNFTTGATTRFSVRIESENTERTSATNE